MSIFILKYTAIGFENLSVKNIWLDNIEYNIINWKVYWDNWKINNKEISNKILSIWIFYQNFLENPIFVLNNINEDYIQTISKLSENNELIKKTYWLEKDFYPINFLKSAIDTTKKYIEFKKQINYENANKLLNSIIDSNNKYYIDSKSRREELDSYDKSFQNKMIINSEWGFVTGLNIIKTDYDKMIQNSLLIKEEINRREKCLNNIKFCEDKKYQIEDKKSNYLDFKNNNFINYNEIFDDLKWIFWVLNWCWENDNLTYYAIRDLYNKSYNLNEIKLYNSEIFKLKPLSEAIPYEKELIKKWAKFFTDIKLNFYSCNNSEYHIKLANIIYFVNKYKNNKLEKINILQIKDKIFEGKFNNVVNFENDFLNSKFPNEINYNTLLEKYNELYFYIKKNNIDWKKLNTELIQKINDIRQNTNNLSLVINWIIIHNTNFINWNIIQTSEAKNLEQKDESINSGKNFLYMNRLAYSILYFNFSPAFYINPEKITYSEKWKKLPKYPNIWLDYDRLIEEYWYFPQEIKNQLKINDNYSKSEFYLEKIKKIF